MNFVEWWELAQRKYDTDATPADVAAALSEPWMAEGRADYREHFLALMKSGEEAGLWDMTLSFIGNGIPLALSPSMAAAADDDAVDMVQLHAVICDLQITVREEASGAMVMDTSAETVANWSAQEGAVERLTAGMRAAHTLWNSLPEHKRGKHPLAALIEGWLLRPVEADKRATAIMPNATRVSSITVLPADDGTLFDLDAWVPTTGAIGAQDQAVLPGLEPDSSLISALPLYLYDGTGAPIYQGGGGAALPLRIWVEVVTAVRIEERERGRSVPIPFTLREMIATQWPDGWQRNNQMPRLRRGMADVDRLRFTVQLPSGGRTSWRAVGWTGIFPHDARLDDVAIAHVILPPGSSHGPKIHKPTLRRLGVKSAAQYRAALGMAYHWWDRAINSRYILPYRKQLLRDRYGNPAKVDGRAILDDSGNPIQKLLSGSGKKRRPHPDLVWIDDQGNLAPFEHAAQEKNPAAWGLEDKKGYPIIRGDDLILLFNSKVKKGTQRRKQLSNARQNLEAMAKEGLCVIENVDGGYRIMPPPWW